jgi:NhaP-type Na+/H+ or K+/H+ antiporter
MNQYIVIVTLIGLATFAMAWMPKISEKTGISYSIFYILFGFTAYKLLPGFLPDPLPQQNGSLTLHLTELIVIISLMGTGIKIDRAFSFRKWAIPLKLVSITMLLCIGITTLLGYYFLGLGLASALLLGAALAPTDPVLASDVQVGPPNEAARSETKFALTSEAGLNDGVSFPFVWLAITVGLANAGSEPNFLHWLGYDLIYRLVAGVALGFLAGKAIGFMVFKVADKYKTLQTRDGLLAVASTLLVYGLTEMIHGYGFIAVFLCAITLRHYEKGHEYHEELHSFSDQTERILISILLLLLGGTFAMGILKPLTWQMIAFVVAFLLLIRPLSGLLGLLKTKIQWKEKLAISFFGIRGMGSVFYLAFAMNEFEFPFEDELWAIVALTILISILLHGFTASSVMKKLTYTPGTKKGRSGAVENLSEEVVTG